MLSRLTQWSLYVFALMAVTTLLLHIFPAPKLPPPPAPVVHEVTRGPQDEEELRREAFLQHAEQLPPDVSSIIWLQQQASNAIQVNAEIPIWGLFLAILGGVGAFFALREQMKAHVKSDDQQFKDVKDTLRAIESDVRAIARRDMKAFAASHDSDDD